MQGSGPFVQQQLFCPLSCVRLACTYACCYTDMQNGVWVWFAAVYGQLLQAVKMRWGLGRRIAVASSKDLEKAEGDSPQVSGSPFAVMSATYQNQSIVRPPTLLENRPPPSRRPYFVGAVRSHDNRDPGDQFFTNMM